VSIDLINLKSKILCLSKWMRDFISYIQCQTHAQVWICLFDSLQEYWRKRTLFEISSAIGTLVTLDVATQTLVDMDLSKNIFDKIMIEREGYAFHVNVTYVWMSDLCSHCGVIEHFAPIVGGCKHIRNLKSQDRKKGQGSKAMKGTKANKENVYSKRK
jgi:hypothetical protein